MKKLLYTFIFTFLICSCNNKPEYFYQKGDSSVQLKINNGNDYLIYDTPTKVDFEWKNINTQTFLIYGTGIRILKTTGNVTKTEINVPKNLLQNDTLNIKVHFEANKEKITTEFNIPMKRE